MTWKKRARIWNMTSVEELLPDDPLKRRILCNLTLIQLKVKTLFRWGSKLSLQWQWKAHPPPWDYVLGYGKAKNGVTHELKDITIKSCISIHLGCSVRASYLSSINHDTINCLSYDDVFISQMQVGCFLQTWTKSTRNTILVLLDLKYL